MNNHYDNKLSSTALLSQTTPDQQPPLKNEQMRSSLRRQSILCNSLLLPSDNSTPKDISNESQNHYNKKCTKNNSSSKSVHIQEEQVDHFADNDIDPVMIKGRAIKKLVLATHSGPSSYSGQAFQTYCRETSLHGWKYVSFSTSSKIERFSWLFLVIGSIISASALVYRATNDFISQTVSTNMESMSMPFDNLYFPAITICNMNFMQRSVLEKYGLHNNETIIDVFDRMMNTGSDENFTDEEIEMFKFVAEKTNGTSQNLKMEGAPECENMFLEYSWKNKVMDFEDGVHAMHYAQTTDASLCCQIFPGILQSENNNKIDINNASFWMKNKNPWQIIFDGYKKGIALGKQGVQVLIDVETYDYFSSHSSGSEGVLVLIQHYRDIPLMRKHSFVLSPGYEVDVGLGITEIATTENAIQRFKPEDRDCYTHHEVNLTSLPAKKGYRMSMKNCLYDKALHATIKECKCKPSFYVLGAVYKNITTCIGEQLDCAFEIFDNVESPKRIKTGTAGIKCQQPCNDQLYNTRITFARYPNRAMFGRRSRGDELCKLSRKLLKICHEWINEGTKGKTSFYFGDELKIRKQVLDREHPTLCDQLTSLLGGNSTMPVSSQFETCSKMRRAFHNTKNGKEAVDALYEYSKRNLLWLNVYVKDSFAKRIIRDEKMTVTRFVANVGGLLGLSMGFSLVSVVELLYFVIKEKVCGVFIALFKKRKRKNIQSPEEREDDATMLQGGKNKIITSSL